VDLDDDIPPALYRVIAELLAWLYRIAAQPKLEIGQELTHCRIELPKCWRRMPTAATCFGTPAGW
jgi:hypothetical protein